MDLKTHYSRLEVPKVCNFKVPIQPGLFKGTYASHGIELIMLTYEDDRKAKATKITVYLASKYISKQYLSIFLCRGIQIYPLERLPFELIFHIACTCIEVSNRIMIVLLKLKQVLLKYIGVTCPLLNLLRFLMTWNIVFLICQIVVEPGDDRTFKRRAYEF